MGNELNSKRGRNAKTKSTERNSESQRRREDENEEGGFHQVADTSKMPEMRKSL
jgi:hypothetical protein